MLSRNPAPDGCSSALCKGAALSSALVPFQCARRKVTIVPVSCAKVTNLPPDSGSLRDVRVLLPGGLAQGGVLVLWGVHLGLKPSL